MHVSESAWCNSDSLQAQGLQNDVNAYCKGQNTWLTDGFGSSATRRAAPRKREWDARSLSNEIVELMLSAASRMELAWKHKFQGVLEVADWASNCDCVHQELHFCVRTQTANTHLLPRLEVGDARGLECAAAR